MPRHYCTFCGAKKNEDKMSLVEYRLLKKSGWVCSEHASALADIVTLRTSNPRPIFLELFCGSKHLSAEASRRGYDTLTVDIEKKFKPDICLDICNLRRSQLPDRVDVVWASPPCTYLSVENIPRHWSKLCIGYRRYHYTPTTPEALECLRIVTATIRLIKKLRPTFYFIENPRGAMRHLPHLQFVPHRRHISYADFGFEYPKPTDIFTNCAYFQPKEYDHASLQYTKTIREIDGAYQRALLPPKLIEHVFDSISFLEKKP